MTQPTAPQPAAPQHDAPQHDVVIAGGGPIGLGLALELARHGVRPVVLEQRPYGTLHPARTNLTNLRSMEHLRRWGIADALRANDPIGPERARSVTWLTTLNGHIVADLAGAFAFADPLPFTSDRAEFAPNAGIERTFQDAAVKHPGIDVRFSSALESFTQDDDGVTFTYTDPSGAARTERAKYLVGADGSRSAVRQALGVRMTGHPDLVEASIWYIHAPEIAARATVGSSSFYHFINEHGDPALLIAQDDEGRYMFCVLPGVEGVDADDWDAYREILFRNVGFEFPVEKINGGRVRVHSLIAPHFDHGRVFLAGDAAHLISPMGGFGMNIGVGDSADLGWKLAAVLRGWGGPRLLESYGIERSTAITWIQQECIDNTAMLAPQFLEPGISADGPEGEAVRARVGARIMDVKSKEYASIGAQLGYRYDGSPIVVPDGTTPPPLSMGPYTPTAFPGARAPHVWLDDETSLYDAFGPGFTLLVLGDGVETAGFEAAARERGVPLTVLDVTAHGLSGLYEANAALIRPDQHVAWRGTAAPADAGAVLDIARGA
ncbi:FAD-dependent monooxygenase [Actinocorallia sp. A-T 12471]|uniref:FAD-dependent monooxygenase n=1 Tax=Actinocorallia sp. A-T 12471 TaxID=3089813 RepID=UPI0029CB7689|nr:FAD-dependent monooxygenase [Actinocorallia sp. A-T 12471]MDX6740042.1 FAD-dependent monooxygenase [Actinocorallia sp. A-T 12471]